MKQKKSTIKFLKTAKKNASIPGKYSSLKKVGRKKPKKNEKDDNMEDVDIESDNVINFKVPDDSQKTSTKVKVGSVKKHKDEMQGLAETDPEFFNYLKNNDASLLEFGNDDDDEDDFDDEDEDEDDSGGEELSSDEDEADDARHKQKAKKNARGSKIEVTTCILDTMIQNALGGSLPELKKLLAVFRTACIPSGDENAGEGDRDSFGSSDHKNVGGRYLIASPEVYEHVMVSCLATAHRAFRKHLDMGGAGENNKAALETMGKHPKWKKIQLLVLSFFKSILHTLSGLADNSQQTQVSVFLIDSLDSYIPFLSPLPRLAKTVTKTLLNIWSFVPTSESGSVEETLNVRGHAFLRVRQMALLLPGAVAEECFRSMYLKFARQCKSFNELNATSVTFMAQCVAELYASDPAMAYQQAFLYIRQLALHLRTAFLKKSAETTRQITSWQYLNCLRLWTRVICTCPSEETGLGALAFPLAQIMFGAMSAATSVYFVPLKFHLIACLHQLAANCKLFIPTAAQILEVLDCGDLVSKPTPSTELPPKLQYLVRLPTDSITRVTVRDVVVAEALTLLRQDTEIYRFHVGLPEYTYMSVRKLKAFAKKSKVPKWRELTRVVVGQVEQYATHAKKERVKLGKAPMAIVDFEPLLPPATPTSSQRLAKLLANNRIDGASEINVSSLPRTAAAPSKDFLRENYALSKKKGKGGKVDQDKKRRHSDYDDDEDESGSEDGSSADEDEDDVSDSGDGSGSDGDSGDEEDDDETGESAQEDSDEPVRDISGMQDSVAAMSWMDDEDDE